MFILSLLFALLLGIHAPVHHRATVRPMDGGGGPVGGCTQLCQTPIAPSPSPTPGISPMDGGGGPVG